MIALTVEGTIKKLSWFFLGGVLVSVRLLARTILGFGLRVFFEVFRGFDPFHELDNFVSRMIHGIKSLTLHFALPRLRRTVEEDIHRLVHAKALVVTERWQRRKVFHVVTEEVLKVDSYFHVLRFASVTTHLAFDTCQDSAR